MIMVAAVINIMHTRPLPFANALSITLSSLPAADRASISELSISEMRAWSAAKSGEHYRYIIVFNTIQNVLAPVHRLPPEILTSIFVEAWKDRKSLRLTHVCRIWRSLLLDTSQFWAVAMAGDEFRLPSDDKDVSDEDYLSAVYLRSSPRNISLRLSSISRQGRLQLIQHAARITSMQISAHIPEHLERLWEVLHAGMPHLETLNVRVHNSFRAAGLGPRGLSTERLPLLTRLTIPARLFRSWPNTYTLQQIALRSDPWNAGVHSPFMVSVEIVLGSLQDYSRLRVLDIRDNTLFHNPVSRPPQACAFPALELLRIRSYRGAVTATLSLLTFPSSTRVEIAIDSGRSFSQRDIFVPGSVLDAVAAPIDQVTIQSGPISTIRGLTGGAERLRLRAHFDQWSFDQFERDIRVFERTGVPVLRLVLAQHPAQRMCPTFEGGSLVFPAFPHVTHLILHGRSRVCAELLSALHPASCDLAADAVPVTRAPLLPLLRDLTVGLATRRGSEISRTLRRGGIACARDAIFVEIHFRECCKIFPEVLDGRAQQGLRLSRLEFFSYEEGCMARPGKPDPVVSHIDLAAFHRDLVEHETEPLRRLVDGPVVFSGYRFFTNA